MKLGDTQANVLLDRVCERWSASTFPSKLKQAYIKTRCWLCLKAMEVWDDRQVKPRNADVIHNEIMFTKALQTS